MTRLVPERVRDPMPPPADEATPTLGASAIYEERWNAIQTTFVDEPRHAVQSADRLVAEAMEDRARIIVSHRDSLQGRWREDDHIDTERLRLVFQEYRTFLHGLLSA